MKRVPALVFGAGVAMVAVVGPSTSSAYADAPSQQGWWSATNPGEIPETGQSPPNVAAAQPDVPSKGLFVEGGAGSTTGSGNTASSPSAYAAVLYEFATGSTAQSFTLKVAPSSATTPNTTLELCPLTSPTIDAQQGGPMSQAPGYDCKINVSSAASSGGTAYTFKNVSSLVSGDKLAVAILPTMPTDRVVLAQPDASSLTVQPPSNPGADPSSLPSPAGSIPPPAELPPPSAVVPTGGSATAVVPSPGVQPLIAAPPSAGVSSTAHPPSGSTEPSPASSGNAPGYNASDFAIPSTSGGSAEPLAVGLLVGALVFGGIVWTAAGRAAVRRDGSRHGPGSALDQPSAA